METVAINGTQKTANGKKAAKAIRRTGAVPCVIYGGAKEVHFTAQEIAFKSLIFSSDFKLAEITVDNNSYKCILKDAQFHPVKDNLMHVDFLELKPNHPVKLEIPVRFKGVSPGVKSGGKLMQKLRKLKIKTTPEKLIDEVTFDISALELGASIRVRDLEAIEGIEVMNSPGIPVASVEIPRALRSAEAAKEEEAEA